MGKMLKKVLTIVVTFTMVFSSLIVLNPVNAKDEVETYAIFPTPHEVVYGEGNFVISDDVNVVYGDGTYLNMEGKKSKTFADLSKMTDEEIASWVEEDWNNRNEVLMYYHQHKDELRADAENSISDSTDSDTIAMIALDDAYREISGTTSEGGEELDPDYLNSVQDQVNAAKDYIINEINTKLAEQGGIAKPRYGFSIYTDASGNNVDKEALILERSGRKEISTTNDIKSGDVYDSHYSGFVVSDGKYFLMRTNHDMAVTFDEIGADGISVDEDVVFE